MALTASLHNDKNTIMKESIELLSTPCAMEGKQSTLKEAKKERVKASKAKTAA